MYKTLLTTAAIATCIAPAMADKRPAPPTEVYVAPVVQACNPAILQVYFKNGDTLLTKQARRAIEETANVLEGCALASVKMISLSADGRTMPETTELAANRIATVSSALADEGLQAVDISAVTDTDQSQTAVNRPMARRVEVQLAAYRPDIG